MPLHGAFTVLLPLCLLIGVSAVPPPTDLTVSCDNTKVVASWKYSQPQPHTRFKVHVKGAAGEYSNETTAHHFDLSFFVWESESRYMEVHVVTVTAKQGSEQSEPVKSKTFTFNDLRPAHIKCKLLFPHPVDLKVVDSQGSLTFPNPLNFYPELQQAKKPDEVVFKFNVTTKDHKNFTGECPVSWKRCERNEISFPEDAEQCVTLRGWLLSGNRVQEVAFNETDLVCPESNIYVIVTAVLLSVTFIIVIILVVCICLTKSWTLKREELTPPETLLLPKPDSRMPFFSIKREFLSSVKVIEETSNERMSVSSKEDEPLTDEPKVPRPAEDGLYRDGLYGDGLYGDGLYTDGRFLENSSQLHEDSVSEDNSVTTEITQIGSEEEEEEEKEKKEEGKEEKGKEEEKEKEEGKEEKEEKKKEKMEEKMEEVEVEWSGYDSPHNCR